MEEKPKPDIKKLVDEHWEFVKGMINLGGHYEEHQLKRLEVIYKTSGLHFWKHCEEYYKSIGK